MIYKEFRGEKLSALGMGAMRLPVLDGVYTQIDQSALDAMVDHAIEGGVNYFDTAWGYHGGQSEAALGRALSRYPRESYYLADKFPGYDLSNMDKVASIFPEQLRRCGVEYFDFYLIHNVCELNIDEYLKPEYRILPYLLEQQRAGRIRHLGFSAHGGCEVIQRFLDAYGEHMEFGQLQVNWVDWTFQNAKDKVALLQKHGLPVWVMEPLRGGKLVSLPQDEAAALRALRPEESPQAMAFRFLQAQAGVTVTLSGMSSLEQLRDNLRIFSEDRPLDAKEMEALLAAGQAMTQRAALPCTACRYCTEHCPQGLDIPMLLSLYNEDVFTGGGFIAPMAMSAMAEDKRPSACVGCRSCEAVCPQQIKISEAMSAFSARLKG